MATTIKAPAGLGAGARSLWRQVNEDFDLRRHQLLILESACREWDMVERLEAVLKDADLSVVGARGQLAAHPLLSEVRKHRTEYLRQIRALELQDEATEAPRSVSARAAASARWRLVK